MHICSLAVATFLVTFSPKFAECKKNISIGIVGAGIGGTSAAYYLRKNFDEMKKSGLINDDVNLNIDIYERGMVGGRMATTTVAKNRYEAGGNLIEAKDVYMNRFVDILGLSKMELYTDKFNDKWKSHSLRVQSDFQTVLFENYLDRGPLLVLKVLWRYGITSALTALRFVLSFDNNFNMIYPYLENGNGATTMTDFLKEMRQNKDDNADMLSFTTITTQDLLDKAGVGDRFIYEFANGATGHFFGQSAKSLPGLAGAQSFSKIGNLAFQWQVEGGNNKIAIGLTWLSKANVINATVTSVELKDNHCQINFSMETDPSYLFSEGRLNNTQDKKLGGDKTNLYDAVVMATPLTEDKTNIDFIGFPSKFTFPGRYKKRVSTLVHACLNMTTMNVNRKDPIGNIFLIPVDVNKINTILLQTPSMRNMNEYTYFDLDPTVWLINSNEVLSDELLNEVFYAREETKVYEWLAYPDYEVIQNEQFDRLGKFVLNDNLYYVNAIEQAASSMEMSAMAGHNIANLITKNIFSNIEI